MKNRRNSDWKRICQYNKGLRKRIIAQTVEAPSLLSANTALVELAREVREEASNFAEGEDPPFIIP